MQFSLHIDFSDPQVNPTQWNGLLSESIFNYPFLRHEYLAAWWVNRGGGEWPLTCELTIVTAHKDSRLVGIAPMFQVVTGDKEPTLFLLGSIEISDYLDVIVRPADLAEFLHGLMDYLPTSPLPWKMLEWHNLVETSPSLPILELEAKKRHWDWSITRSYHAPSIPLTGDFESYLAGIDKKQRHEIRRKMRRAAEQGGVEWYFVEDERALDGEVEAFLSLMAADPEKANFLTEKMRSQMHAICRAAFNAGWLQLSFLTVDGQKAAGYLNFDYQDHIWVYNSGIDRKFMEYSPGWVLLGYLLQWANENKRSEFDFLRGNEEYKYRFGGVDKFLARVSITR